MKSFGINSRAGRAIGAGLVVAQPLQFEAGPRRRRRIARLGEIGAHAHRAFEFRDERRGPLVVPKRRGLAGESSAFVDEHGAMHLAAGAYGRNARRRILDSPENVANRGPRSIPPVERALLRPAELGHDLVMFASGEAQDLAIAGDERSAGAAGADIDGKRQIPRHSASSPISASTRMAIATRRSSNAPP